MATAEIDELRQIRTFPSLVKYLRDKLDWPIESYHFDDLYFEYEADELGIDKKTAAQIQHIKQLRPLSSGQPWGIFFIKFEPKRLPVVALRRILRALVIKKRQAASQSEQATWKLHDLLFISTFGEGDESQINLAHFSENEAGTLPSLKVLGWNEADRDLKVDFIRKEMEQKLRWPDDDTDINGWRKQWSSAFRLKHREVITTSRQLAVELADLACRMRQKANDILAMETEKGPLRKLMNAFREALIHDLDEDGFADMYAQTIAYGLLSTSISRPAGVQAENLADMVPVTNPFLKELLEKFIHIGGPKNGNGTDAGLDFDELGINDVVDLLNEAHMDDVLRDFDNKNPQQDPVTHFYEVFLHEYDAQKRVQRGVYYTPKPVVSYIVRSVHELLQTEFGLEDGLADTTTWREMCRCHSELKIPDGTSPDQPFVQILDPATGTGTFLVEVIDVVFRTLSQKWKQQGLADKHQQKRWNEYVPQHLLPRLYGYELMMAPYAIAHMKIGLKLFETGYHFGSDERVRVYLTNSLEPPLLQQKTFADWVPALAHEARTVDVVKRNQRFTVVIGNPPYSNFGQLNKNSFILGLLNDYKRDLDEKKINLDDDFIKFIRFSEFQLDTAGVGIHGMITNNAYLDGLTHRRMRQHLQQSFPLLRIVNLHGSSKKKEKAPDGTPDENVFDITVGVAIGTFCRPPQSKTASLIYADCWGCRDAKTNQLSGTGTPLTWHTLNPSPEYFFFVPKDFSSDYEYQSGWNIREAFVIWQNGLKTDRDELFFDFEKDALNRRMRQFYAPRLEPQFREQYQIVESSSYDIEARRLNTKFAGKNIRRCLYRPMDIRWLYYEPNLTSRPAGKVMRHMLAGPNLGMIATRQTQEKWDVFVTRHLCGHKSCAAYDINSLFPLYLYEHSSSLKLGSTSIDAADKLNRRPNFSASFLKELATRLRLPQKGTHGLPAGMTSEDIFAYAYAVFHSPGYRSRYAELLKIDFPRLPITTDVELFRVLSGLGDELVALHLMETPRLDRHITTYVGPENAEVEAVSYDGQTVWIDKVKTCGFRGVREHVWNFHIGGYQVCNKWLKDRQAKGGKNPRPGRMLTAADIEHYQRIVVALSETIHLMAEIDEVIDQHGGWPDAFLTEPVDAAATVDVAETDESPPFP